ncbi:MAG: alpha/beta hydrolase [Clostridia bacterium]|nr:alpha/beta hydrolase [Clostridia bacterium]
MSSKEAFFPQIEYFSKYYKVTAIDFLGFGKSAPLTSAFSVSDYAEWTKEVLRALDVRCPSVIAHSFGCRVALKMAECGGQVFDKLILTGPAGVIMNRGFSYRAKVRTYRFVKKLFPNFAEKRFGSAEYRVLSPVMKQSYKKIVNEDLRETASRVENEILILEGRTDTVTPPKEAEAYLSVMQRAKLVYLEGGHFSFAENPTVFNLLAEEFLGYV